MGSLRKYIDRHPKEFFLASIAVIAQSIVFIITIFWGRGGFMWLSDSEGYLDIAKNFLAVKCFCVRPEWGPQAYRTPLYPLFIALFYGLSHGVWFVIFIQNIIAAANIVLTYKLGKIIFGPRAGFLGSLLLIFESARLELASQLMSETVFVFLLLLAVYFFVKFISENKKTHLIVSALAAGLAALTRPALQFFPLGIILFFIIFGIARRNIKQCLLSALLFLMIFVATVSPWLIRNYAHFGKWELASINAYQFYVVHGGRFLEYRLKLDGAGSIDITRALNNKFAKDFNLNRTDDAFKQMMEPQYEDYFFKEGRKIISSDIPFYAWVNVRRMGTFFMESSAARSYGALLYELRPHLPPTLFYPFLYFGGRILRISYNLIILAAFIFFFSAFKKKIWSNLFLIGTISYFAMIASLLTDVGRQRQPIEPFFFLFLANALILFYAKIYAKIKKI